MVDFKISRNAATTDFPHYWETCVGSCHAYTALREDYRQQLRKAHDELGFRYVRFHGLFDDDMSVCIENFDFNGKSKGIKYNFVNVDSIIDFLLSIGMKPFFELGFMPSCIASGSRVFGAYRGNITMPKDDELWVELIRRFVTHVLERYGREEVESWFFEVWNEPNLPAFFAGTQEDYFHLYEITVRTIKQIDSQLRVGGPASSFNAWIPDLINFCTQRDLALDFISTHHYLTDDPLWKSGKDIVQFFKDTSGQLTDYHRGVLKDMVVEAKEQSGDLPLYYTEWNSSAMADDVVHDEAYTATFVAKTLADNDGMVEGYSFWTFTDISSRSSPRIRVFSTAVSVCRPYRALKSRPTASSRSSMSWVISVWPCSRPNLIPPPSFWLCARATICSWSPTTRTFRWVRSSRKASMSTWGRCRARRAASSSVSTTITPTPRGSGSVWAALNIPTPLRSRNYVLLQA